MRGDETYNIRSWDSFNEMSPLVLGGSQASLRFEDAIERGLGVESDLQRQGQNGEVLKIRIYEFGL